LYLCRNAPSPVTAKETVKPVVGRSLTQADSTVSIRLSDTNAASLADSASVHRELVDVDSYRSHGKTAHGWTPKSLLESPTKLKVQDDVVSSSEATQTGMIYFILLLLLSVSV